MLINRVMPLKGIHNFRDYGGYALAGGSHLKTGILWRSAHHEMATDEDLAQIDALNLEIVVDLRGDDEREMHPCRRSDQFRAKILFADGLTAGLAPHLAAGAGSSDASSAHHRMVALYHDMPFRGPLVATMKLYFQALLENDSPSLVHCVAGKDRTGLAVALLHHLVGVHRDDAVQDYLLTNEAGNIEARVVQGGAALRARYGADMNDDAVRTLMSVHAGYLQEAFRSIDAQYGDITSYAAAVLEVDEAKRNKLIERLSA